MTLTDEEVVILYNVLWNHEDMTDDAWALLDKVQPVAEDILNGKTTTECAGA